jgi:UPF0755 protein
MKDTIVNIISGLVIVAVLVITASAFYLNYWIHQPLKFAETKVMKINSGDTLSKIIYQLAKEGIVKQPKLLLLYARFTDRTRIEVGEYNVKETITVDRLLDLFQSGEVISYSVSLIEGKTFKDFLSVLAKEEKLEQTLTDKSFEEIKTLLELEIDHPEGWFYPDTYQFVSGNSDADILLRAHKKMQKVLAEEWEQKQENLPYKSAYEALIMASIIEKETGAAFERPEIAGVFVRRLNKGMRLQTDPTIIYGLGDRYKGNIRRKHLTEATPYNTYVIDGLPPTPIAMPGTAAINAALNPKEGETLFFVAKGDGTHQFSVTLKDHNKAVQEYQIKNRVKNYKSAPPPNNN